MENNDDNNRKTANSPPLAAAIGDGMKFDPSDKQLLISYLLPRVAKMPLPQEGLVLDRDLYGDQEPSEFFEDGDREANNDVKYFFTKLRKKSSRYGTTRIDRTVGSSGTWKSSDGGRDICHNRVVFGFVKNLCYEKNYNKTTSYKDENKETEKGRFRYLMKEYSLSKPVVKCLNKIFNGEVDKDIVLCRIKLKEERKKRARDESKDPGKDVLCSDDEAEIEEVLRDVMKEFNDPQPLQTVYPDDVGTISGENRVEAAREVVPVYMPIFSTLHQQQQQHNIVLQHPLPLAVAASTSDQTSAAAGTSFVVNCYIPGYIVPRHVQHQSGGGS